jgi:YaaC-like Protein
MIDTWEKLYLYESKDLISRLYYEKHNRKLNKDKATEIISQLVQGREYFKSAKQSAEVVKPLLLYYGVLSLSRGLILFLDTNARESSLKGSHGLKALNWNEVLSKGLEQITNIKISFNKGTFMELLSVTRNIERWNVEKAPFPQFFFGESRLGTNLEIDFTVTFDDILSRIPELYSTYNEIFHKYSNCYESHIAIQNVNTHTDLSLLVSKAGFPDEMFIKQRFKMLKDLVVTYSNSSYYLDKEHMKFRLSHTNEQELIEILPHIKNTNDNCYIVAPIAENYKFSSLISYYILSYFLGMLVRYYPSQWLSLIYRSKGDFTFPILIKAINILEVKFPELILEELEFGTTYFTSKEK